MMLLLNAMLAAAMAVAANTPQDASTKPAANEFETTEAFVDLDAMRDVDNVLVNSGGFESAHPDFQFRRLGTQARADGRFEQARRHFRRAARYGDKLSQGAYAEMLWNGEGGEVDRPLAYAWMDLAAERGAPLLVTHRERYWHRLDPAQRARALQAGEAVYAEYADRVAKPRLEREMRIVRNRVTGSRVGWIGNLSICLKSIGPVCIEQRTGEQYYADRYWKPEQYWRWQDEVLRTPDRDGRVDVGAPKPVPTDGGD